MTPLCWVDPSDSIALGPEVVQQTTEKVKLIQERMRATQSRQKSYHDRRRKDLEFAVGDHVFLRVTSWTGVGRALKSRKPTPRFIGPFEILKCSTQLRIKWPYHHLSQISIVSSISLSSKNMFMIHRT